MNKDKISIVANFYNSAKYIPRLIKSIFAQTYQNWELIAVNDCSPSNDLEILSSFADDPRAKGRIQIINNTTNQGISHAKMTGIKAADKVGYFTFIDGDDWLEPNALQSMYEAAKIYDADIIVANTYRNFVFGYKREIRSVANYNAPYDKDKISTELMSAFCGRSILSSCGYWGKLFKKSVVLNSKYHPRNITLYEDLFFNLYCFLAAEKIVFIDDFVYNWRWGGISSASKNRKEKSFGTVGTLRNFNDFYFEKMGIEEICTNSVCVTSLKIELYNVLRSAFGSISSANPMSEKADEVKVLIKDIISLPAYREILSIRGHKYISDQYFFDALENYNTDWLYNFFHDIYKSNSKSRGLRSLVSFIMK